MKEIKTFGKLKEEVILPQYKNVLDMAVEVLVKDRYKENGGKDCSRKKETKQSAKKLVVFWWNMESNKPNSSLSEHRIGFLLVRQLKNEIIEQTLKEL